LGKRGNWVIAQLPDYLITEYHSPNVAAGTINLRYGYGLGASYVMGHIVAFTLVRVKLGVYVKRKAYYFYELGGARMEINFVITGLARLH
jgi:hypothetical protein